MPVPGRRRRPEAPSCRLPAPSGPPSARAPLHRWEASCERPQDAEAVRVSQQTDTNGFYSRVSRGGWARSTRTHLRHCAVTRRARWSPLSCCRGVTGRLPSAPVGLDHQAPAADRPQVRSQHLSQTAARDTGPALRARRARAHLLSWAPLPGPRGCPTLLGQAALTGGREYPPEGPRQVTSLPVEPRPSGPLLSQPCPLALLPGTGRPDDRNPRPAP